jgi:16S rRNA (cytidine1402-2'-O)-methyltransferase
MIRNGNLYLIPTVIADDTQHMVIPPAVTNTLKDVHHFLVEDVRTARRYLSSLKVYEKIEMLKFEVLNKNTSPGEMENYFKPVYEGHNLGILSESGCPGVADPGALAVAFAHSIGVKVVPLVGPSSILLALMVSGLNGQHFAFHGYLPIDKNKLATALKNFEKESREKVQTQLFIETPYRNNPLFSTLLKSLSNETLLCVAIDLTGKNESVQMMRVADWKSKKIEWPKLPAVFLFLAQ